MLTAFDLFWFLYTVSPFIVFVIQTHVARRKVRERERAWRMVEKYILCGASTDPGTVPWPSRLSTLECGDNALAA